MNDVLVIDWPVAAERRRQLRDAPVPCLYVVDDGEAPPTDMSVLEDWAWRHAAPDEVHARLSVLAARAELVGERPWVDDDDILRRGDRWVILRPIQALLMRHLVTHFEAVTTREALELAGWGHPIDGRALDLQVMRLRRRIAGIGLELRNLRGRGFLLCAMAR